MMPEREGAIVLPLGAGAARFPLPPGWTARMARPAAGRPLADLEAAARAALSEPAGGGPRLRDLARPGMRVTLVITDATRPCPDSLFIPLLMEELAEAGVREPDVTVLVALGMHRATTAEERRAKLGVLDGRLRVEDAQGGETAAYLDLGTLDPGDAEVPLPAPVPMLVHRAAVKCDLLIATGVVEPHQYAGFSGGRKTVAIGCAARGTIDVLHGRDFLEDPRTRLGALEENPVHAALERIARRAGLRFVLNVALDEEGRALAVAAGEPAPVLESLVRSLAPVVWTPVGEEPFPVVIAGVGAPKDANLYQASRALTYLAFSPRPVIEDGGWVVLVASCPEGAGEGHGEEEFLRRMRSGVNPGDVLRRLRSEGFGAGGQRAFMVARALERHRCLLVGPDDGGALAAGCHMAWAPDGGAAVELLTGKIGSRARVLVVEHALSTVPIRGPLPPPPR